MDSSSPKKIKLAHQNKVSRKEDEKAVETLIRWAGDDPKEKVSKKLLKGLLMLTKSFFQVIKSLQKSIYLKLLRTFKVMKTW